MASAGLSDTSKDVFGTVIGSGQPVRSDESLLSTVGGPFLAVSYTCTPLQRAGPLAGAVFVFRDVLAVKVAEKEQRALADASAILGSSLDYRDILARVTRSAVPLLADLCFIDELGQDGVARRFDVAFADPLKQGEWAEQVKRCSPHPGWQTPQSQVIESGRAVLLAEYEDPSAVAHDDEHARISAAIGPKSVMVVPLLARERVLGAFTFIMAESNRRYSPRDLRLAEEIGHRAALAIDNARLYEHAQSATRLRDELLAIVSHDLKSPLSAIVMCAESLKQLPDGQVDPRRARRQLASILRAADRMNLLIRDLLDTASIEAGHLSLDVRPLDVASLISDALDQHAELAEAKSIQLERQIAENLPTVVGDAARLQQVLANVLGNGLKFTPPFGTITVAASGSGDLITISVADTGPGIDPADLDHLFDRFWQAGQTARLGTGLGLFIVQHIVNAHGGRVWAASPLGAGPTLSLELPLAGSRGVRSITT